MFTAAAAAAAAGGWNSDPFSFLLYKLLDFKVINSSYFWMLIPLVHLNAVGCAAGGCPDESLVAMSQRQCCNVMSVVLWTKSM